MKLKKHDWSLLTKEINEVKSFEIKLRGKRQ